MLDIYRRLFAFYGPQGWWPAETPFEMCVGAILTQATAWRNVEIAIARLKDNNLLSPGSLVAAGEEVVAELIRPSGYYRQKAKRLIALTGTSFPGAAPWTGSRRRIRKAAPGAAGGPRHRPGDCGLHFALCRRPSGVRGRQPHGEDPASPGPNRSAPRLPPDPANVHGRAAQDPALYQEYHALIVALGKGACNPGRSADYAR